MKQLFQLLTVVSIVLFTACEEEPETKTVTLGDYPVKEYYLERDPRVNVWGAGIDFIHDECELEQTDKDYKYLLETDSFSFDMKFYAVKVYYYVNEELKSEGCPIILLSEDTKACKVGEGVNDFDSLTIVTEEMIALLSNDAQIDLSQYLNEETGFYERETLSDGLENCIIGQSFRSNVLIVPEGKTEQEVQAVYLIQTAEGGYAKFMVKVFKPAQPYQKQTLIRFQVISE